MSISSFIHPQCRHQLYLYHLSVTGSYIHILRKYPYFLLLFDLKYPALNAKPAKQRNQ